MPPVETAVAGHEPIEHRFNETLDRQWFLKAHRLGVRTRIIGKHSVRRCADFESKLDGFVIFNGAEPQFRHRISPAGWRIRSRVTITRSGYPGRIVIVGGMLLSCRSAESRVGNECVSTFRSRWSPYH